MPKNKTKKKYSSSDSFGLIASQLRQTWGALGCEPPPLYFGKDRHLIVCGSQTLVFFFKSVFLHLPHENSWIDQ